MTTMTKNKPSAFYDSEPSSPSKKSAKTITSDSDERLEEYITATNSKIACRSFKDFLKATCKHNSDSDESLTSDFQLISSHQLDFFTELQEPTEEETISITKL